MEAAIWVVAEAELGPTKEDMGRAEMLIKGAAATVVGNVNM